MKNAVIKALNTQRRAGVLLHPTSLPGDLLGGDLGHQAYRFIEFLSKNGFKVWQMLPLGPTHEDCSPYQCLSSHAGNPLLISLDWLEDKGWLFREHIELNCSDEHYREACLLQSFNHFYNNINEEWTGKVSAFINEHECWLDDYVLFVALKKRYKSKPWYEWPHSVRHRDEFVLAEARVDLQFTIRQTLFQQFIFFTQWQEIRDYAKKYGIELFGDMPIFVAKDSADVWAERDNFLMDVDGNMAFVAGVPPDVFSETGQRWGNPLYDWAYMKSSGFKWWIERFDTQLKLFDIIRIDHFRGLQACWQIPETDDTAINGSWVEAPGHELLAALYNAFEHLPLVVEDLGVITNDVIELKNAFNLPGMKVLQFAFDGSNDNPHLPHNHQLNDVVYSGTHDNDTTLGWANDELAYNKNYFKNYIDTNENEPEQHTLSMLRLSMSSVSFLCVVPMQDLLMLDTRARMNVPGTVGGNWSWRFQWKDISVEVLEKMSHYMSMYQR